MKKYFILLSLILAFATIDVFATAPTMGNWRWRADDADEANAHNLAAENSTITIYNSLNIRLRIENYDSDYSMSGDLFDNSNYTLVYSQDQSAWSVITTSDSTNHFALALSSHFADGDVTSSILLTGSGGSYKEGIMVESSTTNSLTLDNGDRAEFEYCIKPTINVLPSTTYYFALADDGSAMGVNGSRPTLTTTGSLPVELTSFTAQLNRQNVVLNWETATEVNNYGFEVQRADISSQISEKVWKLVGFVEGHGNSNSQKEYNFVDANLISGSVSYRLKQIDTDGAFEYSDVVVVETNIQKGFKLDQNFPNPFNPSTIITYSIPEASNVSLKIYNTIGEVVATLVNKYQEVGNYSVTFNASNLPNGVYLYSITVDEYSSIKKMILIK